MSIGLALLIAALALLAGLGIGWLLAGRGVSSLRSERDRLDERVSAADLVRMQLGEVTRERDAALREVEKERAGSGARAEAFELRLAELKDARDAMALQFGEVGAKLLKEAQATFLERANQRFEQAGKEGEDKLKLLLAPVETTLKRYEEGLKEVEKERVGSYAQLNEAVASLARGNEVVQRETQRLANVMRSSPKARGRWGEEQLRTILESAGLAENVDFTLQASVNDGEKLLRPDCVINLPGGRCIVVDVKCPLVSFEQAFDEEDEERRAGHLMAHANAMRSYAADLGRKGYWRQFDLSPDFVIMFVPGEHFLSAAAERAPDLIEQAFRGGVIMASTINMLALAKVMAGMWRQETLAAQAKEIGEVGKELYKRLMTMGDHVHRLGRSLSQAGSAYNSFIGSFDSQVLTQAKRFETLRIDTGGKALEQPQLVDTAMRSLTKIGANDVEAAE